MEQMRFEGRVVVVTGAGGGMGRSHALLLGSRGAKVIVNDLGTGKDGLGVSAEPAERVAAEIVAAGGEAVANGDSVASESGCRAVIAAALERFGRIDGLIHNAGISSGGYPFPEAPAAQFHKVQGVHLAGGFFLSQAAWPHMAAQNYGRIVLISSTAGLLRTSNTAPYAAAKMGLVGLMHTLSVEGEAVGIKVNALSVVADTRLSQGTRAGGSSWSGVGGGAEWRAHYLRPALTSPVAAWLAHEGCAVTGEIWNTGGGHIKRMFIGATKGYGKLDLTMEDIQDNLSQIRDETDYRVFATGGEEFMASIQQLIELGAEPAPSK